MKDLVGSGILWAILKHRRTMEKRLNRKYGSPQYKLKIFTSKTHLHICTSCESAHELAVLCPICYKKVGEETEDVQMRMPLEKKVVVLYDREGVKNQRVPAVMEKTRSVGFSKNLLQGTI
ncbi:hypothetical protein RP20_CCG008708 [Aedes albopictus]|nr:39S ribosomal protein L32, mitochondrial-like [Aedes albopictus]KXJ74883.1 hypothetical protein RP20_CCG012763 [Aedes albopictus]KXJ76912.1 hypothetical protein RP20_CCG008708 [Aedes albopictus]